MCIEPASFCPAWCDPRACEARKLATEHHQTTASCTTNKGIQLDVQLYRMDAPNEVLSNNVLVSMTVTNTRSAAPDAVEVQMAPSECWTLVAALMNHAEQAEVDRRQAVTWW